MKFRKKIFMILVVLLGWQLQAVQPNELPDEVNEILAYDADSGSHIIARYNPRDNTYSVHIITDDSNTSGIIAGQGAQQIYEALLEYDGTQSEDEREDTQEDSQDNQIESDERVSESQFLKVHDFL